MHKTLNRETLFLVVDLCMGGLSLTLPPHGNRFSPRSIEHVPFWFRGAQDPSGLDLVLRSDVAGLIARFTLGTISQKLMQHACMGSRLEVVFFCYLFA